MAKIRTRLIKRFLPRSLLGRSLLIMLVPLVLVLAVALQIFLFSNRSAVSRRFAAAVAGEVATTADLLVRLPDDADRAWILRNALERFDFAARLEPRAALPATDDSYEALAAALEANISRPFALNWDEESQALLVRVALPDSVLVVETPRKRLRLSTVGLFVAWVMGSALLLFAIAALFMRNQVRAIRRLAAAAEAFGLGRDRDPIKPEGAAEVRRAATAFNRMQDRIRRFLQQRTEMLAGVSHDLRTPLTRLRLALAMLPAHEDATAMIGDVEEMERMIGGYLAFARGEGAEQARPTDLAALLEDVATSARRAGADVALDAPGPLMLSLRPEALRRAIMNLVDNARRHARRVSLSAMAAGRSVLVLVDDDGPGIEPSRREEVFRPFTGGGAGGTGLGLTIARDIVRAHGGDVTLEESPMAGLRARIRLPVG